MIEEETVYITETPDELYLRYKIARFIDPVSKALADAVMNTKNEKDLEKAIASFDISLLSQEQLAELFFVLGTRVVSGMITYLLSYAKIDEDLEGAATVSMIRRMLMEANTPTSNG